MAETPKKTSDVKSRFQEFMRIQEVMFHMSPDEIRNAVNEVLGDKNSAPIGISEDFDERRKRILINTKPLKNVSVFRSGFPEKDKADTDMVQFIVTIAKDEKDKSVKRRLYELAILLMESEPPLTYPEIILQSDGFSEGIEKHREIICSYANILLEKLNKAAFAAPPQLN